MRISAVRITPKDEERLKAYAEVTFDGELVVSGIKVIGGPEGCSVRMPSRRAADGTYRDIVAVTGAVLREAITAAVLEEYGKKTGRNVPGTD